MIKKLSLLFVILTITAFALPTQARSVSGGFQDAPSPQAGYSLVYIYRIKVPPGSRAPKLLVDGEEVLQLPNNSYSYFYVSPGSHSIKTKWGFMADAPDLETIMDVNANRIYFLKMEGSVQQMFIATTRVYSGLKEVAEEEARADLVKVKKYSPATMETVSPGAGIANIAKTASDENADNGAGSVEQAFSPAPPPPAGSALVYVYRPDAPPIMRRASILIDDKEMTKLSNKGYTYFYVPAGAHTMKTSWGSIYRGVPKLNVPLNLQAGTTYYFRLGGTKVPKGDYDAHTSSLDLVDEGLSSKELKKIKKYCPAQ